MFHSHPKSFQFASCHSIFLYLCSQSQNTFFHRNTFGICSFSNRGEVQTTEHKFSLLNLYFLVLRKQKGRLKTNHKSIVLSFKITFLKNNIFHSMPSFSLLLFYSHRKIYLPSFLLSFGLPLVLCKK